MFDLKKRKKEIKGKNKKREAEMLHCIFRLPFFYREISSITIAEPSLRQARLYA